MLSVGEDNSRQRHAAFILHGVANDAEGFLASLIIRHNVVTIVCRTLAIPDQLTRFGLGHAMLALSLPDQPSLRIAICFARRFADDRRHFIGANGTGEAKLPRLDGLSVSPLVDAGEVKAPVGGF